ncbi:MAG: hypothetical protein ACRC46_04895 [Thermoguttaceae bacterium]
MKVLSSASVETVESMAVNIEKRLKEIDSIEFTLMVRANTYESSEINETRQEYAFFQSKDPVYPRSWERWKVFYQKTPGVWELDKFVVFNGKAIYTWDRVESVSSGEEFDYWSKGLVQPAITSDSHMNGNQFPWFLFMNVVGYGKSEVDDFVRELGLEKWHIVESETVNEFVLQRIIKRPDWDDLSQYSIRAYLRLAPTLVVWRQETANDFSDETEKIDFSESQSFATFDGICYPAKGRSVSYASKAMPHDLVYEFEVESVKHLTEADKAQWVPDWPTGTIVRDMVADKNFEIRHTREQMLELQETYYTKLNVDREIKTRGRHHLIILIVNFFGVLLLFFLVYKKWIKTKIATFHHKTL